MKGTPRRIKLNYRDAEPDAVGNWLKENNIKYAVMPYYPPDADPNKRITGTLMYWLEVYDARAETAVRLKWKTK